MRRTDKKPALAGALVLFIMAGTPAFGQINLDSIARQSCDDYKRVFLRLAVATKKPVIMDPNTQQQVPAAMRIDRLKATVESLVDSEQSPDIQAALENATSRFMRTNRIDDLARGFDNFMPGCMAAQKRNMQHMIDARQNPQKQERKTPQEQQSQQPRRASEVPTYIPPPVNSSTLRR